MVITKKIVAEQIAAYLQHRLSLSKLVDWAESAMMEGQFDESDMDALRTVVARLGVSDVRTFGLTWDDCEEMRRQLGYSARVEIVTS
jgi:hypothetical protein